MKTHRKRRLRWILYNICAVFCLFLVMEGALAFGLNHPKLIPEWLFSTLRTYYRERDQRILQYRENSARYDSQLFYGLRPGTFQFKNREFETEFSVNSAGFRDDEASLERPTIVVLGDSYTMGWGVEQEDTYVSKLEAALSTKALNTGVSSYGTAREVASLERVDTSNLQYLIIQYCPNDFPENLRFSERGNSLLVSDQEMWENASKAHQRRSAYYPLKHILTVPRIHRRASKQSSRNAESTPPAPMKPPPTMQPAEAFLAVLRNSSKIVDDTQIIVFSLEAEQINNGFINQVKNTLASDRDSSLKRPMSFVDLTGLLDESHRFVLDPHLNAKGHDVVARSLVEHIKQLERVL